MVALLVGGPSNGGGASIALLFVSFPSQCHALSAKYSLINLICHARVHSPEGNCKRPVQLELNLLS